LHQKVLDTNAVAKGITLEKIGKHEEAKARTGACKASMNFKFAPKAMKTCSIDSTLIMGSEGC
jgi:hypothetical protein